MQKGTKKIKKTVRYLDSETGEIIERQYEFPAYYTTEEGYLYKNKGVIIKSFCDRPLPDVFTHAEIGRLSILSYYIGRDQIMGYKKSGMVKPHTVETISEILGQSEKHTRRLLIKAKKYGIIREVVINKDKYFMYNPVYKLAGKRISLIVYMAFQDILCNELPEWVIGNYLSDIQEYNPDVKLLN